MARRRYVSTEISVDKIVNQLAIEYGDFAALLYSWMIPHAEDSCYITADPYEILNKVVPGRKDKTEDDIRIAIQGMVTLELLEVDGKKLRFPPESFYKYQTYIPERKRTSATNAEERRQTPNISEEYRESPLTYPSPTPNLSLPIERDRENTTIDKQLREINNKSFELGLNGISNEFMQDSEMRLKDGTDPELIIKALVKAKDKANTVKGVFPYAISILQGWAAEGIKTVELLKSKLEPKSRSPGGGLSAGHKKRDAGGNEQSISGVGIEI